MKTSAKYCLMAGLLVLTIMLAGCAKNSEDSVNNALTDAQNAKITYGKSENLELKKMCIDAGYEWMLMQPTAGGKIMKGSEDCWGCMVEGVEHVCSMEKFNELSQNMKK